MDEQPPKKQKCTADAKVPPEGLHIGNSDLAMASLPPSLPDVLDEVQTRDKFDAILNPKPIEQDFFPDDYCCPITSRLMRDPVITSDGHTYEREAIEEWLGSHDTSPLAGAAPLTSKTLTPVLFVRNAVDKLLAQRPELRDSKEWYLPESWIRELGQAFEADDEAAIRELASRDRRLLVHTFGNKSVHEGKTAMQLAVVLASKPRTLEVVVELLEKREQGLALAALLQTNPKGLLPLHQAIIAKRHFSTALQIMAWMGKRLSLVTDWPKTYIDCKTAGDIAALFEHLCVTGDTLSKALLWCVSHQDLAKVACLLRLDTGPNTRSKEGKQALYLSVAQQARHAAPGEAEGLGGQLMTMLLEAKADPNVLNKGEDDAPLHLAIRKNLLTTALELTQAYARLDLTLKDGTTPLHEVASKSNNEMADALWGAEAKQLPDSALEATSGPEGDTALHRAAKSGSSAMLRWLVDRGAQITTMNAKRQSILHVAALHNHTQFANDVVELTNKFTARALSSPDSDGNTPLHLAAQAAASAMLCWLLTELELSPSKNLAGQLPRQVAESLGHLATMRAYDETVAMMKTKEEALLAQQGPFGELLLKQQRLIEKQQERLEQLSEAASVQTKAYEARFLRQEQDISKLQSELKRQELQCRVPYFLKHVARGEQKEAEAMIISNVDILLCSGEVTDPAKHSFRTITGFQFAVWALDWRMWEMMLKYLPKEQAARQYAALDGQQVDWRHLGSAVSELVSWWGQKGKKKEGGEPLGAVEKAQQQLPAHVVNESWQAGFSSSTDFGQAELQRSSVLRWYAPGVGMFPGIWLAKRRVYGVSKTDLDLLEHIGRGMGALQAKREQQRALLGQALATSS